jgi:hypothetical protein
LVGREPEEARGRKAAILGGENLARRPDQDVGIPDGRHAVLGDGIDLQLDVTGLIVDRRDPARFGEGEEGVGHEFALVARRYVAAERIEGIEVGAFAALAR